MDQLQFHVDILTFWRRVIGIGGEGYLGENKTFIHFSFCRDEDHLVIHRTPATFIMLTCCGLCLSVEEVSPSVSLAC